MKRFAWWPLYIIFPAFGFGTPSKASSLLIEYFATITSDVQVGPILTSPLPANAVGTQLFIAEDFQPNPNPPVRADMFYTPFIAQATFFILPPSGSPPTCTGPVRADSPCNPYHVQPSTQSPQAYTLQPISAFYSPNSAGFTSTMLGGTDLISGLGTLDLSQAGTSFSADLSVIYPTATFSSRTLDFSVQVSYIQVSPVPLPPALPMFAAGLLAVSVFGFVTRKRDRFISA
jgi:hypothetical protein